MPKLVAESVWGSPAQRLPNLLSGAGAMFDVDHHEKPVGPSSPFCNSQFSDDRSAFGLQAAASMVRNSGLGGASHLS